MPNGCLMGVLMGASVAISTCFFLGQPRRCDLSYAFLKIFDDKSSLSASADKRIEAKRREHNGRWSVVIW